MLELIIFLVGGLASILSILIPIIKRIPTSESRLKELEDIVNKVLLPIDKDTPVEKIVEYLNKVVKETNFLIGKKINLV